MADADTRAAKRRRFTSPLVTIKVGADAEVFTIHEADLKENSPFFKAALDAKWREGQTREISLPEDEPDVVVTYLDWLSSNDIPFYLDDSGDVDFSLLFKLYIFGDKIEDDIFCICVINVICRGLDHEDEYGMLTPPLPSDIKILYEGTPPSSPLRALIAKDHAGRVRAEWFTEGLDETYDICPTEFFVDMIKELAKLRGEPKVGGWEGKEYRFWKKK